MTQYAKAYINQSPVVNPALTDQHVDIGSPLNARTAVDTSSVGDIAADTTNGLTLKAGIIDNADVNASAAIAFSKLAALTASRAIQSGAGGVIEVSSVNSTELGYVSGVTSAIQTQLDAKLDDFTSTTDNALVRTNGTAGEAVQDSGILIDDSDNISAIGNLGMSGTITIGADVTLYRDSANVLRTADSLVIDGDLTVSGTTTTLDTTNLQVEDVNILLNNNASVAPADDVAGISIERGATGADASLVWNESNQRFKMGLVASEIDIVDVSSSQTLTNKTLTTPIIAQISNTGTLTLPTSTDTLVGRDTTDTLTNKTLTTPIISTISNTGTLTLPTSTDTLVGRDTTDTLTNKTMTRIANSFTRTVTTYSAVQTLDPTVDDVVLVSGNTTLNLPAVASSSGVEFQIKKTDSNATTVTLDGNLSETIDGSTTHTLVEQYTSVTIVCDGSAWYIL